MNSKQNIIYHDNL